MRSRQLLRALCRPLPAFLLVTSSAISLVAASPRQDSYFSAPPTTNEALLDANACRRNLKGILGEIRRLYGVPAKPVMADTLVPLVSIVQQDSMLALEKAADPRRSVALTLPPRASPSVAPIHGRWNGGVEPPPASTSVAGEAPSGHSARIPQRAGQAMRVLLESTVTPPQRASTDASTLSTTPLDDSKPSSPLSTLPAGGFEVVIKGRFGMAAESAIVPSIQDAAAAPRASRSFDAKDAQASAVAVILRELEMFYGAAAGNLLGPSTQSAPRPDSQLQLLRLALAAGGGVITLNVPMGQIVVNASAAPYTEVRWRTLERQHYPSLSSAQKTGLSQDDVDAIASVFAIAAHVFRFGGDEVSLQTGAPSTRIDAATLNMRAVRAIPEHSLLRRTAVSISSAFDRLEQNDGSTDPPAEWWAKHAGPSTPSPALLAATPSSVAGLLTAASARVIQARRELARVNAEAALAEKE